MNKIIITTCLFLSSLTVNSATIEHIINGDFETGDFTGWNVVNTSLGSWHVNYGNVFGYYAPKAPISGIYDALTSQSAPGALDLFQDVYLSSSFSSAILSWDDRIQSAVGFSDPNQGWRVLIEDLTGALISEVFSTHPGDSTSQLGPNIRTFDLTSLLTPYANQSIRISFEHQGNLSFLRTTLDNVSFITTSPVPAPAAIWLFGSCLIGLIGKKRGHPSKNQLNKTP